MNRANARASPSPASTGIINNSTVVYGAELHYLEAGDGPMVILLHGLEGNALQWCNVTPALAEHFYVMALDQIGFGNSDKPLLNYRIGTLVDFLAGFCQELAIERAVFVGEGIGGWTATALALQFPHLVERLVLIDPILNSTTWNFELELYSPPATRQQTQELLQRLFYDKDRFANSEAVNQMFANKVISNDGYSAWQLIESIRRHEDDFDERLSQLTIPTLILHGCRDELTPLTVSQRLHRVLRGSQLRIIEQCGHFPHLEQPEEFMTAILEFLHRD